MIEYSLIFQEKPDGGWEIRHEMGVCVFPSEKERVPLDSGHVAPGQYFIRGPKITEFLEAQTQQEAAQWLADLHESEGKEAGKGMEPFLVYQRK